MLRNDLRHVLRNSVSILGYLRITPSDHLSLLRNGTVISILLRNGILK